MDLSRYNVVAITGAGLSVESGIPTYRGPDGIYTKIQKTLGKPIEDIIHPTTAKSNPELFWQYWWTIKEVIDASKPNKAHHLLKEISGKAKSFLEITQNIDGLSLKSGMNDDQIIEIHGSANLYHCIRCGLKSDLDGFPRAGVPNCPSCIPTKKSIFRPNVVMFTENIKSEHYKRAISRASQCDVMLIIGTELHFDYLIDMVMTARSNKAIIIWINPEPFIGFKYYDYFYNIYSNYDALEINKTASEGIQEVIDMASNNNLYHKLM